MYTLSKSAASGLCCVLIDTAEVMLTQLGLFDLSCYKLTD